MHHRVTALRFCLALSLTLEACGDPSSIVDDGSVDVDAAVPLEDAGFAIDSDLPEPLPDASTAVDASRFEDSAPMQLDAPLQRDATAANDAWFPPIARYDLQARFPEGGTYDPVGDAFYVGSLGDGSVHSIDRRTGRDTLLFRETAPGSWWSLGMDVDVVRRRLWVCAMDDQRETTSASPPYQGWIWVFDLDTGERVVRRDLNDSGQRATCTDVAVAADGRAFVVDRESPRIYRLGETGPVEVFVEDDLLSAAVIGQNAVVILPDQSAMLVLLYLPSRLTRVDLRTRAVRDVDITGAFRDLFPALSGADGMTLSGSNLIVAFTSAIYTLEPTLGDWTAARSSSVDVPAGMTDVIHARGEDYLLNGQAVRFALQQTPDPFTLVRFHAP